MLKRILPLVAAIFLLTAVSPLFAQTEDEIVAKYLQKIEKKHKHKMGFASAYFKYGKLKNDIGYKEFNFSASSDITTISGSVDPDVGIWRSKEFGFNFGMLISKSVAFKLGFDYWLTMGDNVEVDQTMTIGTFDFDDTYTAKSDVSVYGLKVGFDYFLTNPPDQSGTIPGLAVKVGGGGGIYMASWKLWSADDQDSEPLKANAPGFWIHGGLEYPTNVMGLVLAADASYFFLNFKNLDSYNQAGGELDLTYPDDGKELALNFSGPRGKIELKRYFQW
jgi:hypothetical protein